MCFFLDYPHPLTVQPPKDVIIQYSRDRLFEESSSRPSSLSHRGCPAVEGVLEHVFGEAVVHLQEAGRVSLGAVGPRGPRGPLHQALPAQRVHGDVGQRERRGGRGSADAGHLEAHGRCVARRFGRVRAGARTSPAVAIAGDARVRRGRRAGRPGRRGHRALVAVAARLHVSLLVLVDVHVDGDHADGLGHDERERPRVEGPAVAVVVLLVLVLLVARVTDVTGDVNNDADDVAQT